MRRQNFVEAEIEVVVEDTAAGPGGSRFVGQGVEVEGWQVHCLDRLADVGAATLVCPMAASPLLANALSFLATNPVQTVYLSVFARVQAVRRVENVFHVDVDVAEALQ